MTTDDPVVQRVRQTRQRIAEQCGHDPHRLYEWAKRIEAEHLDRVVGFDRSTVAPSNPPAPTTHEK